MQDTIDNINIAGTLFRGERIFFDEGTRGHIQLADHVTGETLVRVVHPGAGQQLQIVGYGTPVQREVIEWLFERAEAHLV